MAEVPVEVVEILEEIEAITTETIEAMEVVGEAATESIEVIDVGLEEAEVMEDLLVEGSEEVFADAEVESSIQSEASSASSEIESSLKESGVSEGELGVESGSTVARTGAAERAGADVAKGVPRWKRYGKKFIKFAEIYIVADFVIKEIIKIFSTIIDSTKNPKWKGSLTEKDKEQVKKVKDAILSLKPIIESWEKALDVLNENKMMSYGTMNVTVGGRAQEVQVIDVVAYLIQDAGETQISEAQNLLKNGNDGITVFDITQLSNCIFAAFADAQAIIDLRDNKGNIVKDDMLSKFEFPPKDDDKEVRRVLMDDFPEWQDKVNNQAFDLAKTGATMAVNAFVKSHVILTVNSYMRKYIYPQIKTAAEKAGKQAASNYVSSQKASIIAESFIPIMGTEMAKAKGKEVQKVAIQKAQDAAKQAGKEKAKQLQSKIQKDLKPVVQKVMDANKDVMKQIADYAAKQIMKTVIPP